MAIDDIIYTESDSFIIEITGTNSNVDDILFDNPLIEELEGTNGLTTDILFDPSMTSEIPNVLITDFGFI